MQGRIYNRRVKRGKRVQNLALAYSSGVPSAASPLMPRDSICNLPKEIGGLDAAEYTAVPLAVAA